VLKVIINLNEESISVLSISVLIAMVIIIDFSAN